MLKDFEGLSRRSFLKLSGATAGVVGAGALAGCGGGGETADTSEVSAEGTDDGTEITLWTPLSAGAPGAERRRRLQRQP